MIRSKYVFLFLIFLAGLTSTSCQNYNQNSYLIIAMDSLADDAVNCSDERTAQSGFYLLCQESIRLTHLHTSSLQSAAAMGSLLTGEYPVQNKLHRSFDRIHDDSVTIADLAMKQGYRTSFFSGGPHILRKTGLSRSFETFDDSIAAQQNTIFKDFKSQAQDFLNWASESPKPFFSVIYNSELDIINEKDTNNSNLELFDEKLYEFFTEMKAKNLWQKTYIILIGLNGKNKFNRISETSYSNLHSENTLIGGLIKTPRSKGDEGVRWKYDPVLSLADIGLTLKCAFQKCADLDSTNSYLKNFPIHSFHQNWFDAKSNTYLSRKILIEAVDTRNKLEISTLFSIVDKNYLYIENKKPENSGHIYNSLIDILEINDISSAQKDLLTEYENSLNVVRQNNRVGEWAFVENLIEKENYQYWLNYSQKKTFRRIQSEKNPLSVFVLQNWLKDGVEQNDFKKWALENKNKYAGLSMNLAALGVPKDICYQILTRKKLTKDDLKSCEDDLFLLYIKYKRANQIGLNEEAAKNTYMSAKKKFMNDAKRHSQNLALENIWGINDPNQNWIHPLIFLDNQFFN